MTWSSWFLEVSQKREHCFQEELAVKEACKFSRSLSEKVTDRVSPPPAQHIRLSWTCPLVALNLFCNGAEFVLAWRTPTSHPTTSVSWRELSTLILLTLSPSVEISHGGDNHLCGCPPNVTLCDLQFTPFQKRMQWVPVVRQSSRTW